MELFFRKAGSGPTMVILHGLYGSSDNWMSIAKSLETQFELFIPDQRNHGRSPKSEEMNYEVLTKDILDFFDQHQIEKAILLGHSMGGKIAMNFAFNYPERIEQLIIADISPKRNKESKNYKLIFKHHQFILDTILSLPLNEIENRDRAYDLLLEKFHDERLTGFLLKNLKRNKDKSFYWSVNFEVIKRELNAILEGFTEEELSNYAGTTGFPVLFLKGSLSSYLTNADIEYIEQVFPYADIEEIQDAGHWLHAEQPEEFVRKVVEFVNG